MSSIIGKPLPASWEKDGVKISKQPDEMTMDEWREALKFYPRNVARIPDQDDPAFKSLIDTAFEADPHVLYVLRQPSLEQVESAVKRAPEVLSLYMNICRRHDNIDFDPELFKGAIQSLADLPVDQHPAQFDDVITTAIRIDFNARGADAIPYWESIFPYLKDDIFHFSSIHKLSRETILFEEHIKPYWSEETLYHMIRLEPYHDMVKLVGGLNQFTDEMLEKIIDESPTLYQHLTSPSYPVMLKIIDKMLYEHEATAAYNTMASYNMRKSLPLNPVRIGLASPTPCLADDTYGIPGLTRVLRAASDYPEKIELADYQKAIRPVLASIPFGKSVMDEWQQQTTVGRTALDALPDLIDALDYLKRAGNDEVKACIDVDSNRISEGMNKQLSLALDRIDETMKPHIEGKPYHFDDRYTL
jgi:hypothetical protein